MFQGCAKNLRQSMPVVKSDDALRVLGPRNSFASFWGRPTKEALGSLPETFQLVLQHLRTSQQHLIRKLRGACWFALLKDFESGFLPLLGHFEQFFFHRVSPQEFAAEVRENSLLRTGVGTQRGSQ